MDLKIEAAQNLQAIKENDYPGRMIICGRDKTGQFLIQGYSIMGRREESRNRVFVVDEDSGIVQTATANPKLAKGSNLTLYTAMAEKNLRYVVSNGDQTMTALNNGQPGGLNGLLSQWEYEPDPPHYTPRITAVIDAENLTIAEMLIIKKSATDDSCLRWSYNVPIDQCGFGHCITTYDNDGDPLPAFSRLPYLLPLTGNIQEVAKNIWANLNEDNRVSIAIKFIDTETGKSQVIIINRYAQVPIED